MKSRSEQLRERHRRIMGWSLVGAVAVHAVAFLLMPAFRAEPLGGADPPLDTIGVAGGANAEVEVLFGPPTISAQDGTDWTEPPERVLPAERAVRLDPDCVALITGDRMPLRGRVRLRVKASGRVDVLGLPESTGDACGDRIAKEVAGDLWYHWLPNDRFPAPVDLVQPVVLLAAR